MAVQNPDTKEEQDSAYNPAERLAAEKIAGSASVSAGIDQAEAFANDPANASTNPSASAREQETNPDNLNWTGSGEKTNDKKGFGYFKSGSFMRKKGPIFSIVALIALGVGGPLALLPLGPIMFVENIVSDLNDQVAAMDSRFLWMARNKIPKADRAEAIKGCGKVVTIRCKFATIGDKQIAKLKYAGITVDGDTTAIRGRTVPKTYTFRGETFNAKEWANLIDGRAATSIEGNQHPRGSPMSSSAIKAQRLANNARYSSVSDASFMSRVYKRFGITKKPPELKGRTTAERVNALLNKAGTSNVGDLKFTKVVDADGNDIPGKDDKPQYTLDGDDSPNPTRYTSDQRAKMEKAIASIKNYKPPSKLKTGAIGVLSVVGYWDLLCTVKNTIQAATVAAKVANMSQSIQYAAPVLASVHNIKAGEATAEDGETIGTFFSDTDVQKEIADFAGADVNEDKAAGETTFTNIPTKDNPNFGKNALDSELYKMSTNGGVAPSTETRAQFSLGYGQNSLLSSMSGSAGVLSDVANLGSDTCNVVQSWWARAGGLVAGVALIATGSGALYQGAKAIGTIAVVGSALYALNSVINRALENNLVEDADLEHDPVGRGELAWTGTAAMLQEGSKARGMIPASSDEIVAYQSLQQETLVAYNEIEKSQVTNQFDIQNEFSFAGGLARSILPFTPSIDDASSYAFLGTNLLQKSLSSIISPTTLAKPINTDRFKQCDDEAYNDKELGIDADVQCNIRYVMPAEDLALDTDVVAKYMEENVVNPETGLPEGYSPPDPVTSQAGLTGFIKGAGEGLVDSVTPDSFTNDYARFLEFCVYRQMPYGETGKDGGENDWSTGKKCREKAFPFNYYRIYTLDKTIQEAEDDEGIESSDTAAPTGEAGTISVATYNVKRVGENHGTIENTGRAADLMKERGVSIIGVQEIDGGEQYSTFLSHLGSNFAGKVNVDEGGGRAIFWDTNLFSLGKSGVYTSQKEGKPKEMVWVELKSASGGSAYIFDMHTQSGDASSPWDSIRAGNAQDTLNAVENVVGSSGSPVIIMGDMNSNYSSPGRSAVFDKFKNSGKLDLTTFKAKELKGEDCDTVGYNGRQQCGKSPYGSHLDQIWISNNSGITVNSWENIANSETITISDHNPVVVNLDVPGLGSEEDSTNIPQPSKDGWVWPVPSVKDLGILPWGASGSKGIHKGIDIGNRTNALGSPVVAAHDGTITKSYGKGNSCGYYVIIKATGTPYWMGYQHLDDASATTATVGKTVKAGDVIGKVGRQGGSTCGSKGFFHLHFSVETKNTISEYADPGNNGTINPLTVLPR